MDYGVGKPGFKTYFYFLLDLCLWENSYSSWSHYFLSYRVRTITPLTECGLQGNEVSGVPGSQ